MLSERLKWGAKQKGRPGGRKQNGSFLYWVIQADIQICAIESGRL